MKHKIAVISATRAELGAMSKLIQKLHSNHFFELQLIVTGAHLSAEFGNTSSEISGLGLPIFEEIEILLSSDTAEAINKSMGLAMIGFGSYFAKNKPSLAVVIGDRFEMLAVASSAMIAGVPIAHISGGEISEGAIDDMIRHAITKLSHYHFVGTESFRKRVIQMGEQPQAVFNVGDIGLDVVKSINFLSKAELEESLGITISNQCILITYHPCTTEYGKNEKHFQMLLDVLQGYKKYQQIFTYPNADLEGRAIIKNIKHYVKNHPFAYAYKSLGNQKYLSLLKYVRVVIGNSSSGLIEVPEFKIPTVNIGNRQKGRLHGNTVLSTPCTYNEINEALSKALSKGFKDFIAADGVNPYSTGKETSSLIIEKLKTILKEAEITPKKFLDIKFEDDKYS